MVNVAQYNKIKVWGKTLAECTNLYIQALKDNGIDVSGSQPPPVEPGPGGEPTVDPNGMATITGTITDIRSAVVNGNTTYYLQLDSVAPYYSITAAQTPGVVLLNKGESVTVDFMPAPGDIVRAITVVWKQARTEPMIPAVEPAAD